MTLQPHFRSALEQYMEEMCIRLNHKLSRIPDPGGVGDGSRGDSVSLVPETVGLESHAAVLQVLATIQTSAQLYIAVDRRERWN